MSLGSLTSRIILDKNSYTNQDPYITGHVAILYNYSSANTSGTLFGPLKIILQLCGRSKTKIFERTMYSHTTYRGRAELVNRFHRIHDSPVQADGKEELIFPFALKMPTQAQEIRDQSVPSVYESHAYFANEGHALPPTMEVQCKDDASVYSGRPPFESFVEYWISARLEMPGIDVQVQKVRDLKFVYVVSSSAEKQAQAQRAGRTQSCRELAVVRTRRLLPENAQRHGLRQKAKAMMSGERQTTPSFTWLVKIMTPEKIWTGSWFEVAVGAAPYAVQGVDQKQDSAVDTPDIMLQSLSIYLLSTTRVRAEKEIMSEHSSEVERKEQLIVQKTWREGGLPLVLGSATPEETTSRVVKKDLIPSFKTWNISRQYVLAITCRFSVAGELADVEKRMDIEVGAAQPDQGDGAAPEYQAGMSVGSSQVEKQVHSGLLPPPPPYEG
ncbi:hypothetical protein LTR78_003957 [Recurvomyces mirabilis]|uniref:Arrestin-like N-terminal domain-containing protein n=1 Tax=Recurvomyces mirabilis TaxID=574656 RepID=A0AAE0WQZ0_9PEZI|nr:hypothetical protein LTR78_003957 [Recurvomyces mirabilis]KAK5153905.1 hypothetical protein LTS14_007125 [Recurvomyces mirabilis]